MKILERLQDGYPALLEAIVAFGDTALVTIQSLYLAFGLPLLLVLMAIVEKEGIEAGLAWFLSDEAMASNGALALILFNIGVEFQIAQMRKGDSDPGYEWSLRIVAQDITYRLGLSKNFKRRKKPKEVRFLGLRRWVTMSVFVLALSGRMRTMIESVGDAPFIEGAQQVITTSSFSEMAQWAGGTLFTMTALFGVQILTAYIAARVIDVRETVKRRAAAQKAAKTRARKARVSDAYHVTKTRDIRLQPIRVTVEGKKHKQYKCPECEKVMSRQGWAQHPCRHETHFTPQFTADGHDIDALDALDNGLTPQESQADVNQVKHVNSNSK